MEVFIFDYTKSKEIDALNLAFKFSKYPQTNIFLERNNGHPARDLWMSHCFLGRDMFLINEGAFAKEKIKRV